MRANSEHGPMLEPAIFEGVDRVRSVFSLAGERTPESPLGHNMSVAAPVVREGLQLVSGGELEGLSLDEAVALEIEAAHQRRAKLIEYIAADAVIRNVSCPRPVAGANIVRVHDGTIGDLTIDSASRQVADASILMEQGYANIITPADCPVIDIVDPNSGGVVAQVHAGWQGEVAGIIPEAMRQLKELGLNPWHALVNINPNATEGFELGGEGLEKWREAGLGEFVTEQAGATYISMTDAAKAQLVEAGVREGRIQTSGAYATDGRDLNSLTDPRFYSHRNRNVNGITGRNAAVLARVDY